MRKSRRGFTLIEVLVSTALLAFLLLVVASLTSDTASISTASQRKMTAEASARQVLDRFSTDISTALILPDLPVRIEKNAGNDMVGFYVQTEGYQGDRKISRVVYRLDGDRLMRGVTGLSWEAGVDDRVDWGASAFTLPENENFEILGRGIIRFELMFLLKNGTMVGTVASFTEVAAMVVGIVAIDPQALELMNEEDAAAQQLAALFPDPSAGVVTDDLYTQWTNLMEQSGFGGGFPEGVISKIKVYERVFPLR